MATEVTSIRWRVDELEAIDRYAEEHNLTRNGVVRVAACRLVGLGLPAWAERLEPEPRRERAAL